MQESSFDIDADQLAETSARFPARRRAPQHAAPTADVSYLATTPRTEHARHAWDEAGHI